MVSMKEKDEQLILNFCLLSHFKSCVKLKSQSLTNLVVG